MRLGSDHDGGRGEPGRFGDRLTGFLETFEVESERVAHLALDVLAPVATQPARSGTYAENPASSLPSITIRYWRSVIGRPRALPV
jgi:hypothetical protein